MHKERTPTGFLTIVGFFRDVVALIRVLSLPRRIAPVPMRRRAVFGTTRRIPPRGVARWLPLLVGVVLLTAVAAWAGQPTLPAGVPDIHDPGVRAQFEPVGVSNLLGKEDFPVLYVVNRGGEKPQAMLIGLDARNGKATWSLATDPIILIVVFSENATVQGVYVDLGFAALGKASGTYAVVDEVQSPVLPDLLKAVAEAVTRTYI